MGAFFSSAAPPVEFEPLRLAIVCPVHNERSVRQLEATIKQARARHHPRRAATLPTHMHRRGRRSRGARAGARAVQDHAHPQHSSSTGRAAVASRRSGGSSVRLCRTASALDASATCKRGFRRRRTCPWSASRGCSTRCTPRRCARGRRMHGEGQQRTHKEPRWEHQRKEERRSHKRRRCVWVHRGVPGTSVG